MPTQPVFLLLLPPLCPWTWNIRACGWGLCAPAGAALGQLASSVLLQKKARALLSSFCFETLVGGEICSAPAKISGAAFCPPDSTQLICQVLPHTHTHTHGEAPVSLFACSKGSINPRSCLPKVSVSLSVFDPTVLKKVSEPSR